MAIMAAKYKHLDELYECSIVKEIDGSIDAFNTILAYNNKKGGLPCYVNKCFLNFMDLLSLGWILRYLFDKNALRVEYAMVKHIDYA